MAQGLLFPESQIMMRWLLECGYLYVALGRRAEARAVFEGAEAIGADTELPTIGVGDTYCADGAFDRAVDVYRRALERWPNSGLAKTHLAEALHFSKRSDEARALLEVVVKAEPMSPVAKLARAVTEGIDADLAAPADRS